MSHLTNLPCLTQSASLIHLRLFTTNFHIIISDKIYLQILVKRSLQKYAFCKLFISQNICGFLQILCFPPKVPKQAFEVNSRLSVFSTIECVWLCDGLVTRPVYKLSSFLVRWDSLQSSVTLSWMKQHKRWMKACGSVSNLNVVGSLS